MVLIVSCQCGWNTTCSLTQCSPNQKTLFSGQCKRDIKICTGFSVVYQDINFFPSVENEKNFLGNETGLIVEKSLWLLRVLLIALRLFVCESYFSCLFFFLQNWFEAVCCLRNFIEKFLTEPVTSVTTVISISCSLTTSQGGLLFFVLVMAFDQGYLWLALQVLTDFCLFMANAWRSKMTQTIRKYITTLIPARQTRLGYTRHMNFLITLYQVYFDVLKCLERLSYLV